MARCGDFLLEAVVLPPAPCHKERGSPSWSGEEGGSSLRTESEKLGTPGFRSGSLREWEEASMARGEVGKAAGRGPESSWLAGVWVGLGLEQGVQKTAA